MNDKEYSFEEFFASGTGIESEKTETSSLSFENFDGYFDGVSMEMYQTNEDIEFLNSFEAVSRKNEEDKIMMLKKLKTTYNFKSVESYCDNQIQSFEFSKEESSDNKEKGYGLSDKIKDKLVAFFQKIAEFVKRFIDMITVKKYKGTVAEEIKKTLKIIYDGNKKYEKKLMSPTCELSKDDNIRIITKIYSNERISMLNTLKIYSLGYKIARLHIKDIPHGEIDTDKVANANIFAGDIIKNTNSIVNTTYKMSSFLLQNVENFCKSHVDDNADALLKRHLKLSEDAAKLSEELNQKLIKDYEAEKERLKNSKES